MGDGPFPAGRVVLDWPLNEKHRLRFIVAPLGIDETGAASQPIVFQDTAFAPGWYSLLDFEGLAAPQGRAIDAALKLGYDVTPNITIAGGYRILDGGADNDDLYPFARFDSAVLGLTWGFR